MEGLFASHRSDRFTSSATIGDFMTRDDFANCFRYMAAGVAVVGSIADGLPFGVTVSSIRSVSSVPPQFTFSLNRGSATLSLMRRVDSLVVSMLSSDQRVVAERFSSDRSNRFESTQYELLPSGEPLIEGALGWVRGRMNSTYELEGAVLFVVDAIEGSARRQSAPPLVHFDRSYL